MCPKIMKVRKVLKVRKQMTDMQIGQIKAHMEPPHNMSGHGIAKLVKKPDGKHKYSVQAILNAMAKIRANPNSAPLRKAGSGRPRKTTKKQDRMIVREVFRSRGKAKATVAYLKKKFPMLRKLSDTLVQERLLEAGLAWMRRRRKTLVAKKYVANRLRHCRWVGKQSESTLRKIAYSDGTVWYLDRTEEEAEQSVRKSLGAMVYRQVDYKDALYQDCVGPSSYAKAQGTPVKVWGLLAKGKLNIRILPHKQNMNRWWYAWIIEHDFPRWLDGCKYIIQDFERSLRCPEPLEAMEAIGAEVLASFPKCSQDMNAIENAWNLLKDRLNVTMPTEMEDRDAFIVRLRNAVAWLNHNKGDTLLALCRDQKKRAKDLLYVTGLDNIGCMYHGHMLTYAFLHDSAFNAEVQCGGNSFMMTPLV